MAKLVGLLRKLEKWPSSVSTLMALLSIAVSLTTLGIELLSGPPDPGPLVSLVEREAALTVAGDVEGVLSLYVPGAIIRDLGVAAATGAHREVQSWIGAERIRERYEMLRSRAIFPELVHLNINVTFDPTGTMGRAVSSTEGSMRWDQGPKQSITTQGGEEWEFVRVGDDWRIKSFTCHRPESDD